MSDFTQIARDILAYEEEQLSVHQYRKSLVLAEIDLIKYWGDWLGDFISLLNEYGVVKDLPDRFVISIHKLRLALARHLHMKDRPSLEQHYLALRKLAGQGQFARFGRGFDTIELAKLHPEYFKSFLPPGYECTTESVQDNEPTVKTTLEHKIGEVVQGADIKYGNATDSYIWQACPICGKQEWVRLGRTGKPQTKRCADCMLFKRLLPPSSPKRKNGAGYVLVRLEATDFFYPMTNKYGYVMEHRLVMARHLQRCLQQWEVVHHKNGIKSDNRLENLELVASIGEHIANHNTGYVGGYKHGLHDGRNDQIKQLKERIGGLEAQIGRVVTQ